MQEHGSTTNGSCGVDTAPPWSLIFELHQLPGPHVWEEIFGRCGPFHIDIGSGRDTFLIELGQARPDLALVGFEYSRERIEKLARKIKRAGLNSVRLVRGEALQGIARLFAPGSIAGITLFFPDPWPKKRHAHKRLISPPAARLFASRLRPQGTLYFKTDDAAFALQALQVLEKTPFLYNCYGPGAWAPCEGLLAHRTLYEKKWLNQGRRIYRLAYVRTDEP